MTNQLRTPFVPMLLAAALLLPPALAQVRGVQIEQREPIAAGRAFGAAGAYERLVGKITFGFEPDHRFNARIVDLEHAPRDGDGQVVATANLIVLQATDPSKRSGVGLLEVSNRGGRAALRYFDLATGAAPYGDGLLLNRGVTLIWVGWQADIVPDPSRMSLAAPVAQGPDGRPITGLVRADWTIDAPTQELWLAHREHHRPIAIHEPDSDRHRLTYRTSRDGERTEIPRSAWRFRDDGLQIVVDGGPIAGRIYELVYEGERPAVVGLGLAAIRDTMAYAKHDPRCAFAVTHGIALGISQTGRFLRHFLYQGFNTDTAGRQVFDGMMILTAGAGRGSFNHRFAQPSRDGHRYSAFFFPTDLFPFTSQLQEDPVTGSHDGLLARQHDPDHAPRVFYINTGYEYWGRAAALIHTSVDGTRDVEPGDRERIYHIAGAQHYRGSFANNPIDHYLVYRPLMVAMLDWVQRDRLPPPSCYPRRDDGSLVEVGAIRAPTIPGVTWPQVAHVAYRADYGLQWRRGIVTTQPPALGPAFPTLVPQVDELGHAIAGLHTLETRVPLGTYLPWRLRTGLAGGNGELVDFTGGFVPLATTEAARERAGDARTSLAQRYGNRKGFAARIRAAAAQMVAERLLLPEDVERAVANNLAIWDRVSGR